ncbi:LEAF RUST 10 DISEASE-RESISTANCE LOCUS RECEPTOR-LIKE PROTEIN KINASE-like 2.1 [Prunus yedoensis var. nudiflora]|uniref:non-specific serine/threonine protein kinase n=1 Tax=Prunus yedoensis var. nudiflora TaxID=2094558 RepID=A0A314YRC5_PRUYE|nr:LEAF RUST 10 DISEASE-RESISTANCE LOCUS RECEPTOR-LIKE PROTEIN KINASE-like 2.1 [Prunus yedoensis var. nudiflora]
MHPLLLQSLFPLLLITSFLSVNVELSLGQDNEQYANCGEDINCGGVGGITYPFWGVNRANYCGLPGFEVKCVDNAPMINMSNINYRILKMNSIASSVTVARQDYWETICPLTYVNTNINFSLFSYTSGVTNLTFYYGCNTSVPGLTSSSNPPSDPVATGACKNGVTVPVFTTAVVALEANQMTIGEAVDGGSELDLEIDDDQCNRCVESGGKCGLNTTNGGFSCFCHDQAYATICNTTSLGRQGWSAKTGVGNWEFCAI